MQIEGLTLNQSAYILYWANIEGKSGDGRKSPYYKEYKRALEEMNYNEEYIQAGYLLDFCDTLREFIQRIVIDIEDIK